MVHSMGSTKYKNIFVFDTLAFIYWQQKNFSKVIQLLINDSVDINHYDRLVIPIYHQIQKHWSLVVVDCTNEIIEHFDSFYKPNEDIIKIISLRFNKTKYLKTFFSYKLENQRILLSQAK